MGSTAPHVWPLWRPWQGASFFKFFFDLEGGEGAVDGERATGEGVPDDCHMALRGETHEKRGEVGRWKQRFSEPALQRYFFVVYW